MRHRITIFGRGRVGTAMSLEMPGVPVISRGADCECDIACVCWPAHAVKEFAATHPIGARGRKVAFCNGAWAVEDGADEAGCCYVRAVNKGDRAADGYKGWRVGDAGIARTLCEAGLGVVRSVTNHDAFIWGKALYILPLAIACDELGVSAREAANTDLWVEWFDVVMELGSAAVGAGAMQSQMKRAQYLVDRVPKGWQPSSTTEEINYFKRRLVCAD